MVKHNSRDEEQEEYKVDNSEEDEDEEGGDSTKVYRSKHKGNHKKLRINQDIGDSDKKFSHAKTFSGRLRDLEETVVSNLFGKQDEDTQDDTDHDKTKAEREDAAIIFEPSPMLERGPRLIDQYPDCTIDDFSRVQFIGRGAFGNVDLVNCKLNNLPYALKEMSKAEITRQNRFKHLMREKDIMNKCIHPNIVRLETTVKDDEF